MDSGTGSCYITLKMVNGEWLISASEVKDIKEKYTEIGSLPLFSFMFEYIIKPLSFFTYYILLNSLQHNPDF